MTKSKEVRAKLTSLRGHKSHFNQNMKQAEGALSIYKSLRTEDQRARIKEFSDKFEDQQFKIQAIYAELIQLDPDDADTYEKQHDEIDARALSFSDRILEAEREIATSFGTPTSGAANNQGGGQSKCKVISDLKPKPLLEVDDPPARLRIWKADFKFYYQESHMESTSLSSQQGYFLACLSNGLKEKIRNDIENLPIFSDDATTRTCFSVLDEMSLLTFPLIKRRQQYFDEKQHAGQKTSEFLERIVVLAKEADIEKLSAEDHLVFRCLQGMNSCNDELKRKILEVEELNLDKLKKTVNNFEAAKSCLDSLNPAAKYSANQGTQKGKGQRNNTNQGQKCDRCGRDHKLSQCTYPADIKCNNCGDKGHIAAACPKSEKSKPPPQPPAPQQEGGESSEDDDNPKKVPVARLKGVRRVSAFAVNNKEVMNSAEESAPRIKVLISSRGTEACSRDGLPDTGADINHIDRDAADIERQELRDKAKEYHDSRFEAFGRHILTRGRPPEHALSDFTP